MKRLKVLVSAYACRPEEGSEPGVGWNLVRELAAYHDLWVLTRANNCPAIAAELSKNPLPGLQVIYCEPSQSLQKFNYRQRLVHLHYYLWQIKAYFVARKLHQQLNFDLVHHVTYVRYSTPSFLALLPIPFIWGPVGGGESAPQIFWRDFSWRGKTYEILRSLVRGTGELDPFVRLTARKSVLAKGTTKDTALRLQKLGAMKVEVFSQLGLSQEELDLLAQYGQSSPSAVRFLSIGRLLHWKGFHLGLQAFARAELPDSAEYWIVGEGPERSRLESLAVELKIDRQVKFWSKLSRVETLKKLSACMALIHPSLHESGGLVCLEAMAAGRPVICLDLGGPALQVTEETGFKIAAVDRDRTVADLAAAMGNLAQNSQLWEEMSRASQRRVREVYSWEIKGQFFARLYEDVLQLTERSNLSISEKN